MQFMLRCLNVCVWVEVEHVLILGVESESWLLLLAYRELN